MKASTHQGAAPAFHLALRVGVLALAAFGLAGCTDRLATGSTISDDYRERHPIIVGEKPVTLHLVPGAKLDPGARGRLAQFAADAREEGMGRVEILVPAGAMNEAQARAALPDVRSALAEGGSALAVSIGSYPASNPRAASPLRISYRAVRAAVAHRCGEWPVDLASGSSLETWENKSYWNYGCSYQNMIASQVDDPNDLEAQRPSTSADVRTRSRAIERVRQGSDPSTVWSTPPIAIGTVGGK